MPEPAAATNAVRSVGGLQRVPRRRKTSIVPQPLDDEPGLLIVDSTWGTIQPMQVADGVRTIGELELIEHCERGLPLIDCRRSEFYLLGTIPSARSLPHVDLLNRIGELDRSRPTVFFCNGPQCAATPSAIHKLLESNYPAEALLYYRGGIHDWMTLGLPSTVQQPTPANDPKLDEPAAQATNIKNAGQYAQDSFPESLTRTEPPC